MVNGQVYGEGRSNFGWWAQNKIYSWYITEVYTWNLHNVINPIKFNLKNK